MLINNVWSVEQLPYNYIVELPDMTLKLIYIAPFRRITEADLTPYKGHHPRNMRGNPLPDYLYRHYGFEKNQETADKVVHVRFTPTAFTQLKSKADGEGKSVSDYIRDLVL